MYEFNDNGHWVEITDANAIKQLDRLAKGEIKKGSYTIGGHSYEVHPSGYAHCEFTQMNTNTQTSRAIRDRSKHAAPVDANSQILFGKESIIELPPSLVDELLSEYDFNVDQAYENSMTLAELAQEYSALGSGFKYMRGSKGKKTTRSEKWIKPPALWQWLTLAKARGYTRARVIMHGGKQITYDGVRNDPIGFDLQYAGQQGEAYGKGFYFGLSDHVTVGYNRHSGKKDGTFIVGLLLTNEKIGWSHRGRMNHHGGVTLVEDDEWGKMYKTFGLSAPTSGVDNCVVVHEGNLALPIGFAEAL